MRRRWTGLPVRDGDGFRCIDCGGSIEGYPSCGGWLELRMGKFGRFLGCSNFPDCDYTRNLPVILRVSGDDETVVLLLARSHGSDLAWV